MITKFLRFLKSESGAVTVDWVVLTAAIVGLGMAVLVPIGFTTDEGAQGVAVTIRNLNVGYEATK
ncbi:Flp family type IVb pilin [Pseudorhodobacter sp. W20_MBD10_FR17]|uniref:Flp family type IVb pilin n=1 Tax=Pseudorhodobacter sp. W20_MBD10_FR17 TaxID=3240266 RepID=UPI003F97C0FD